MAAIALVFGSSGGIGSAVLAELAAIRRFDLTLGFSRTGNLPVDVTIENSIVSAAGHVRALDGDVRLVIDATGFLHGNGFGPEKSWNQIDPVHMATAFAVNAIGPALLMKHFLPLLAPAGRTVFATLSAKVGSIGDNHLGGWYSYRASKAALNQLVRTAAIELKRRRPAAICVALHPGTVESALSKPYAKGGLTVRTPAEAARRLLETIEGLRVDASGGFFACDGGRLEW